MTSSRLTLRGTIEGVDAQPSHRSQRRSTVVREAMRPEGSKPTHQGGDVIGGGGDQCDHRLTFQCSLHLAPGVIPATESDDDTEAKPSTVSLYLWVYIGDTGGSSSGEAAANNYDDDRSASWGLVKRATQRGPTAFITDTLNTSHCSAWVKCVCMLRPASSSSTSAEKFEYSALSRSRSLSLAGGGGGGGGARARSRRSSSIMAASALYNQRSGGSRGSFLDGSSNHPSGFDDGCHFEGTITIPNLRRRGAQWLLRNQTTTAIGVVVFHTHATSSSCPQGGASLHLLGGGYQKGGGQCGGGRFIPVIANETSTTTRSTDVVHHTTPFGSSPSRRPPAAGTPAMTTSLLMSPQRSDDIFVLWDFSIVPSSGSSAVGGGGDDDDAIIMRQSLTGLGYHPSLKATVTNNRASSPQARNQPRSVSVHDNNNDNNDAMQHRRSIASSAGSHRRPRASSSASSSTATSSSPHHHHSCHPTSPMEYHKRFAFLRDVLVNREHCEKLQERFQTLVASSAHTSDRHVCSTMVANLHVPLELCGGMYNAKTQWFITALADAMILTSMMREHSTGWSDGSQQQQHHSSSSLVIRLASAKSASRALQQSSGGDHINSNNNALRFFLSPGSVIDALLRCCRNPKDILQSRFRGDIDERIIISELGATSTGGVTSAAVNAENGTTSSSSSSSSHFLVEWYDFALLATAGHDAWEHVLFPLIERYYTFPPLLAKMRQCAPFQYATIEQIREHILWVAAAILRQQQQPTQGGSGSGGCGGGQQRKSSDEVLDRMFPPWIAAGGYNPLQLHLAATRGSRSASIFGSAAGGAQGSYGSMPESIPTTTTSSSPQPNSRRYSLIGSSPPPPPAIGHTALTPPSWLKCFIKPSGRAVAKLGVLPPKEWIEELHVTPCRIIWALLPLEMGDLVTDRTSRSHVYLSTQKRMARHTRMSQTHGAALVLSLQHTLMHRYLHRWLLFQRQKREFTRKRAAIANGMIRKAESRLLSSYFARWRLKVV